MPVYIRKNVTFTPSSLADGGDLEIDDDDFIQDPDQVRDPLPQPFRLIDKMCTILFDRAWDIISNREDARVKEASRVRAPQYHHDAQLQDHGETCCIASSPDTQYVFVGLRDGIAVIKAHSKEIVSIYKEDKLEIVSIQVSHISENSYLVSSIDDMGTARLFGFIPNHIYFIQTFTDDAASKSVACKCEVSRDGEYIGISYENGTSQEAWIEFHKLPKDALVKELDAAGNKDTKKSPEEQQINEHETESASSRSQKSGGSAEEPLNEDPSENGSTPRQPLAGDGAEGSQTTEHLTPAVPEERPASRVGSAAEKTMHKFSSGTIILKVNQPQPITGINWTSPLAATRTVDSSGDVIGAGGQHLLTAPHLDMRNTIFEQIREAQLKYLPKDFRMPMATPTFHFASGGRYLPHGLDATNPCTGPITAVMVWWSGCPKIFHYSLSKPAKELEHKPEVVWPLAALPTFSVVSPCTSLLAVALDNNNVVVWDKYMGIIRCVHHLPERVFSLCWLDPCVCPTNQEVASVPVRITTAAYLHITLADGCSQLLNTGLNTGELTRDVNPPIERSSELYTRVVPIKGLPQLVLSVRVNGQVFIEDVLSGETLCEVVPPPGVVFPTPWDPVMAPADSGHMLYIRGEEEKPSERATDEDENQESPAVPSSSTCLVVFTLRSFPTLDKYREKTFEPVPFMVHNNVESRTNAILADRLAQQVVRKEYMETRWGQLKTELAAIKKLRAENDKKPRSAAYPRPQRAH